MQEINKGTNKTCNTVKCDVNNCIYNEKSCICTAEKIEVGPHYAASSKDTVCSTFKQK